MGDIKIKMYLLIIGMLTIVNLSGQNLDQHLWKNRVLLLQTNKELSKKYEEQLIEFSHSEEAFAERKLVVYLIMEKEYKMINYPTQKTIEKGQVERELFTSILKESIPFNIVLIGLDGGIKLRTSELLKKEELFNTIDSMPMRRAELKNKW